MSDPQALHTELLAKIDGDDFRPRCAGDTPWFCGADEYKTAVAAVRAVLELHKPIADDLWTSAGKRQGWQCEECASRCHSGSGLNCDEPLDAEYPCETVKVIASALGVVADG